jgi:hypothetical protein
MTSNGPTSEAYDMKSMYDFSDTRADYKLKLNQKSISGILKNHPDTQRFSSILKISGLEELYDDQQANFTVLVTIDKHIPQDIFVNIDDSIARHIIKTVTMNRRIPGELLKDNPASIFITNDPPNKLFITNIDETTYINDYVKIIESNIMASNGIIHLTNGIIWPEII